MAAAAAQLSAMIGLRKHADATDFDFDDVAGLHP